MVFEDSSFFPNMHMFSDADKPHLYLVDRVNVYKELIKQKIMPNLICLVISNKSEMPSYLSLTYGTMSLSQYFTALGCLVCKCTSLR